MSKENYWKNVQCGVLVKVDQPTDWVNNLVIVEKKNVNLLNVFRYKGIKRSNQIGALSINSIEYQLCKKMQVSLG